MADKVKVYLAAPLFGLTERRTNRELATAIMALMPDVEIILPQDFKYHGRFNDPRTFNTIFKTCVRGVDEAQVVVAILDGADSDSGTCFEVGYAYAKGIPIIAVRTDYRANQEKGVNLMLSQSCAIFVFRPAFDECIEALANDIARALKRVLNQQPSVPKTRPATVGGRKP